MQPEAVVQPEVRLQYDKEHSTSSACCNVRVCTRKARKQIQNLIFQPQQTYYCVPTWVGSRNILLYDLIVLLQPLLMDVLDIW